MKNCRICNVEIKNGNTCDVCYWSWAHKTFNGLDTVTSVNGMRTNRPQPNLAESSVQAYTEQQSTLAKAGATN